MSLVNSLTPIVCPNATTGAYSASSVGGGSFSATRSIGGINNGATSATLFTINPALFPTPGAQYFTTFCFSVDSITYATAPLFTGFFIIRVSQTGAPTASVSIPAIAATAVNSAYFFNIATVLTRSSNAITVTVSNFSGYATVLGDIDIVSMTIQEMPAPVGLITGPEA
jgi:hypothetical protein